jgi:hypothetical protein
MKRAIMQQQELFGHLSLSDGQLLLDGVSLPNGQLVAFKFGKSRWLHARVILHQNGYWFLDLSEFAGHTYYNIILDPREFHDLTVKVVEDE